MLSLSKKGFDNSNGGGPSPILRDGRMVSLPIPEPRARDGVVAATFSSIFHDGAGYYDLMTRLGYSRLKRPLGKRSEYIPLLIGTATHLDPDLVREARARHPEWRGMFGQVDGPQTHLANQGVGVGSLFLFWGWFERETTLAFHRSEGFSAIYGYLEVDKVFYVGRDVIPPSGPYHPHFDPLYPRQRNCVYLARRTLSWNPKKPGWGVFNYDPRLRLSIEGRGRSEWSLPGCFHPDEACELSYNTDRELWGDPGNLTTLRIPARGQEFVCRLATDIEAWARKLIDDTPIWSPIIP